MKYGWLIAFSFILSGCMKAHQLTHNSHGHTLHHNGVFSPDGQWIVFDGRNDDTKIGENEWVGIISSNGKEEKIIYNTKNQQPFGPGVGAASFSPAQDRVIFIHGLADASWEKPYAMTRRTGIAVDISSPFQPILMDARDVQPPYTPGSLRGGTHSHGWSGDGQLISFTYNDEFVESDLRTVGVMIPVSREISVENISGNNPGIYYSAIVAELKNSLKAGSDEINKAFDECWVGKNGYINAQGKPIPYAIAFQGNVLASDGNIKTEIFIVDIDPEKILADTSAVGKPGESPRVPKGIVPRRLTFSEKGLSGTRHWLRSSPDGKWIYGLAKDEKGQNQIIGADVLTGEIHWLTHNPHSIDFSFNLDSKGERIAYIAQNRLFIFDFQSEEEKLIFEGNKNEHLTGVPSFSPDGLIIVFNQYKKGKNGRMNLQIMRCNIRYYPYGENKK